MAWITPKTDWKSSTKFTYTDYNRIKNNLMFINDMLNEMYPEKAVPLDLGADLNYEGNYLPSQFNAFEDALQSFTRVGGNVNVGQKKVWKDNAPFIGYQDLNRIESCCLKWRNYTPPITTSIEIKPTAQSLNVGNSCTFTVICKPDTAQDKENYTVTCSDTSVVTIEKKGMNVIATAGGAGSVTITVSNNGHSATAIVQVQEILVTQITPSEMNFEVNKDESKIITLSFIPTNAVNIKDWTVSVNNNNVSVTRISDNQIKVTGNIGNSTSLITVSCGSISVTMRATVPQCLNDLWVTNADTTIDKWNEIYSPQISHYFVPVGGNKYTVLSIITNPASIFDRNKVEVSFSDNSICRCDYRGANNKLYLMGMKAGKTTMTVSSMGLSYDVEITVY